MSNEHLILRCQLGERTAFAELVHTWHSQLERYVQRMLATADTDDVTQEVWLAVFRGLPRLRQPDRFAPWLFTVARRAVTNQLRADYARPEPADDTDPGGTAEPDETDAALDRSALNDALGGLPVREREVLLLFYLQDLPLDACAEICAVPVGTIKSRLNRARRLLRAELVRKGYPV